MFEERRGFTRLDLSLRTSYRILESLGEHDQTVTKDISEQGIRIPLNERVAPGTFLEIALSVPGDPDPIRAIGRVIWTRFNPDTRLNDTGIHLVHIKQVDQERLLKHALH